MRLDRLVEYSHGLADRPVLYGESVIRYIVELDSLDIPSRHWLIDTSDPSSLETKRGARLLVPHIQRAKAVKPILFASNSEYTFGLARDPKHARRVRDCHRAYLEIVTRCAEHCHLVEVLAVHRFLTSEPLSRLHLPTDFDRGASITFRVNGKFIADLPAVRKFWADEHSPSNRISSNARILQCIVCNEKRPVVTRLQSRIKGVPNGQKSGTLIISANAEAFESYGLVASTVAPTCSRCGEQFTRALNDLLSKQVHNIMIARTAFVFWSRTTTDLSVRALLSEPRASTVRELLESPALRRDIGDAKPIGFYAIGLSASGARAVVRDWIESTLGDVRLNLRRWFRRQAINGPSGEAPRPMPLAVLAGATVREFQDLRPRNACALIKAALTGAPIPLNLLYDALRRTRTEQRITQARAALIKLVLRSRTVSVGEDTMMHLEVSDKSPAYLCGRLLAVLERAQRLATLGSAPTRAARLFGTASSAPLSAFPQLLRAAQADLAMLESEQVSDRNAIQLKLEEILTGIGAFPATLTLEEQGLFSLGYYHQRAHDRSEGTRASALSSAETGVHHETKK